MASWQPTAYKQYQWIVADPQLLAVGHFEHVGQDVILQRVVNPRVCDDWQSARRLQTVTNLPHMLKLTHYSTSRRKAGDSSSSSNAWLAGMSLEDIDQSSGVPFRIKPCPKF
jgi:hypothetical protein